MRSENPAGNGAQAADRVKIANSEDTQSSAVLTSAAAQDQDPDADEQLHMAAWVFEYLSNGHPTGTEPSPDDVQAAMVQYWGCVYDGCFTHIGCWSWLNAADVVVHLDWAHNLPVSRAA